MKLNIIIIMLSFILSSKIYAQTRPYAPGIIQIPSSNLNQQRNSNNRNNSAAQNNQSATVVASASSANEVISPDDPLFAQKTLRAQYRLQIATLQSQITVLDRLISGTTSPATNTADANNTKVATTPAPTGASAMINNARLKYSKADIADSVPVQRVSNGSSTTLLCPSGYMYHNPDGGILKGNETCVPVPKTASNTTVTPGNVPIPATKSDRGTMDKCPEGYIQTSSPNDGYQTIMCTPRITEIAPGKYNCLFGEEWPEIDANGKMNCVGAVNKDGSARVCSEDAIASQNCAPGSFYSKKTKQYYATREEAQIASGYTPATTTTSSSTTTRPSNDQIKAYLQAYKEDITKPENVARIKKDAADNGVSAAELDSIMSWPAGTAQKAFDEVQSP